MLAYPEINLSQYIETHLMGDRPHLKDQRLPVATIAHSLRDNPSLSVANLAQQFNVSETEILAVLLYYAQHQDLVDVQEKLNELNKPYRKAGSARGLVTIAENFDDSLDEFAEYME